MNQRIQQTINNKLRRKHRVRAVVSGTSERPRLSISISNRHVTAQIIDDTKHTTIAYATTVGKKKQDDNMTELAAEIGTEIGKKAVAAKLKRVVFDRNGKLYHGRVKALADAARAEGLEF